MDKNLLQVGLVQERWYENPDIHKEKLAQGVKQAVLKGAQLVCLQELTLNPYFCTRPDRIPDSFKEDPYTGPTALFIAELCKLYKVAITASLFENSGYNTAIASNAQGEITALTRKQHIPSGEKYHENYYFKSGNSNYPVHTLLNHRIGLPTCYDQWFPELARIYSLKGAELLIYPTAIGSEPTAPEVDTQPMWQKIMIGQAIMANVFMIAVNRIGTEDGLTFYGSSFICNPMGEILAQAPRQEPAVLTATIDFNQRQLWGRLFPFAQQRQPETYNDLLIKER